jgi:predicted dehydrogenase
MNSGTDAVRGVHSGRLRVGLIGTGYWADETHAPGIAARDDLDFIGVWGRSIEKTAEFATRQQTTPYPTPDALFRHVDLVLFAVPPAIQAELAPAAAAAGCHLLLEKPIAMSPEAADRIAAACIGNDVRSIVNFSSLFGGISGEWMRDVVGSGSWDGGGVTILSDLRVVDTPFSASPWRLRDNGSLWDVGPHALSMLIAALGPVVDVQSHHGRGDTFVLSLLHKRGAVSTATLSYSVPAGASNFTVEFWGDSGRVTVPSTSPTADVSRVGAIAPALGALIESIRTGEESRYDARFGAEIVRILSEAEISAAVDRTGSAAVPMTDQRQEHPNAD